MVRRTQRLSDSSPQRPVQVPIGDSYVTLRPIGPSCGSRLAEFVGMQDSVGGDHDDAASGTQTTRQRLGKPGVEPSGENRSPAMSTLVAPEAARQELDAQIERVRQAAIGRLRDAGTPLPLSTLMQQLTESTDYPREVVSRALAGLLTSAALTLTPDRLVHLSSSTSQ